MKREGDVWAKFISKDYIKKAIINAAKGKRRYRKVRKVLDFDVRPSEKKPGSDYLKMQIRYEGRKRFIGGGYQFLCDFLKNAEKQYGKDQLLPLTDVIIRHKRGYYFDGTIDEE